MPMVITRAVAVTTMITIAMTIMRGIPIAIL